MIYEYPEEFIIPVIYVDDLKVKSSYRHEDFESSRNWKLLILDEELQEDEMFQGNKHIYPNKNEDINFLDMDEELLPQLYKEAKMNDNKVEESLDDEHVKRILNDIDNEFANSETLCIYSKN